MSFKDAVWQILLILISSPIIADQCFQRTRVNLMYAAHFAAGLAIKSRVPKAPTWALLVGAFVSPCPLCRLP